MSDLLLRRRLMMVGGSPTPPTPIVLQPFSVGANKQVYFSPGNLQWSATNGGTTSTTHATADGLGAAGTWRFAENQWDYVGDASQGTVYGVGGDSTIKCNNANVSQIYQGWIDLIYWGTSGYNGKQPYQASSVSGNNDISGTNYDWGVYNAIYNPKTHTTDPAGTWRILTNDEFVYIFNTRSTTSGVRYAKAQVNGSNGLIIVPDEWTTHTYTLNSTNTTGANYSTNVISLNDWNVLEEAGCVFLPAAGHRTANINSFGNYWSGTANAYNNSYIAVFTNTAFVQSYNNPRGSGISVRLVRDVI